MKQQLVEHESGYEMNIWSFEPKPPLSPRFVCASLSAAEPALATWPQLKMRKVDEKSKKFSVFLSRSPSLSVSPSLPLSSCAGETKWNFQLSCQQHTPPRRRVASDGMGDSAESPSPVQLSLSDTQKLERCSSFSSSSTWIGESVGGGRHTVDTFNDYCRPLKITSKSFAHKAASGIHATNPKGKAKLFAESFRNCNCWSFRNSRGIRFSYRWLSAWQWNRKSLNSIRVNWAFLRFALQEWFAPLAVLNYFSLFLNTKTRQNLKQNTTSWLELYFDGTLLH